MASNSIRIEADLFDAARSEGELMSRSAAQQVEHWARMGAALESVGLTVGDVAELLNARFAPNTTDEASLWKFKRDWQRTDMKNAKAGLVSQDQLSWFSGGKAKRTKVFGQPY